MSPKYYKGYRVGTLERGILKIILNIKNCELPNKYDESFSDIFKTARQKWEYNSVTRNLVNKGLLKYINKNGKIGIILTTKGEKVAAEYSIKGFDLIKRPKTWDNKWRLVMFDIPESKKKIRNVIRFHLKRIGFVQVQGSVWLYPYPCEELIILLKNNFYMENEVLYVTTESFEKDSHYKKIFKLK